MYQAVLSKIVGFVGAGPREDLVFGYRGALQSSANVGGVVFQLFGPLIVAFLAGLLFVGLFQVEFGQFSNWYIRIIFTLSILLHIVLLFAASAHMGFGGVLLVVFSFVFTVLQILAALSLVQTIMGVGSVEGTLLHTYREFILHIVELFRGKDISDETRAAAGDGVNKFVYKYSYDVFVQIGAAIVLGVLGLFNSAKNA